MFKARTTRILVVFASFVGVSEDEGPMALPSLSLELLLLSHGQSLTTSEAFLPFMFASVCTFLGPMVW